VTENAFPNHRVIPSGHVSEDKSTIAVEGSKGAVSEADADVSTSTFEALPIDSTMSLKNVRSVCSSVVVSSAPMPCASLESGVDGAVASAELSGAKLASSVGRSQNSVPPIAWKSSVDCGAVSDEKSKACRSSRGGREGSMCMMSAGEVLPAASTMVFVLSVPEESLVLVMTASEERSASESRPPAAGASP